MIQKANEIRIPLVVQWLGLCSPNVLPCVK